jgi:hypothetical protein
MRSYLKEKWRLRSRKLRLTTVGDPPRWPRDTPLSTTIGTKFRRQVAVAQSVLFACRLRATKFVCCLFHHLPYSLESKTRDCFLDLKFLKWGRLTCDGLEESTMKNYLVKQKGKRDLHIHNIRHGAVNTETGTNENRKVFLLNFLAYNIVTWQCMKPRTVAWKLKNSCRTNTNW